MFSLGLAEKEGELDIRPQPPTNSHQASEASSSVDHDRTYPITSYETLNQIDFSKKKKTVVDFITIIKEMLAYFNEEI